jgi:hypothetical protein
MACLFVPGAVLARLLRPRSERDEDAPEEREEARQRTNAVARRLLNPRLLDVVLPLILGVAIWALGWLDDNIIAPEWRSALWEVLIGLALGVCLYFAYINNRSIRFGLGVAAVIVFATIAGGTSSLYEDRSFFGVYRVIGDEGTQDAYHALVVGDTNHGAEVLGPKPPVPIAYHDPTGPFGQLFELLPSKTVDDSPIAVMGLGAGVMSCYAEPGQQWTFYEIDPLVESIARNPNLFTYLRDCPGNYDVVLGDARLKLAEAPNNEYGMIVGEAFSSDAIPVHLMTREAVDMYLQKLKSDGVLVMHISNRHLRLEPVVGDLAQDRGLVCYSQYDGDLENPQSPYPEYKLASNFTVLARDEADLGSVPSDERWQPCMTSDDPESDVWTDDFSNLLSTLVWN